jgi:hypothetical protein
LPKNFYKLKLTLSHRDILSPEESESFFISWKNRISQKSLSLTIFCDIYLNRDRESMKMIERYTKLGVVKEFKTEE